MHFLVLGDTKSGYLGHFSGKKVLGSTNIVHFLVLGDTVLILRSYSKKILQMKNKMDFICTFGFFFVTLRPILKTIKN